MFQQKLVLVDVAVGSALSTLEGEHFHVGDSADEDAAAQVERACRGRVAPMAEDRPNGEWT